MKNVGLSNYQLLIPNQIPKHEECVIVEDIWTIILSYLSFFELLPIGQVSKNFLITSRNMVRELPDCSIVSQTLLLRYPCLTVLDLSRNSEIFDTDVFTFTNVKKLILKSNDTITSS